MIINLRGTSGSGKSTIVTHLMRQFNTRKPIFIEDRKRPLGYELDEGLCLRSELHEIGEGGVLSRVRTAVNLHKTFVVGHYETPCGGCDTLSFPGSQDKIWELVRSYHHQEFHVIFEGVIVGDDKKRTIQAYSDVLPLLLIELDTPLKECLKGIQERRDARGNTRPINPNNTSKRMPRIHKRMAQFKALGMDVRVLSREETLRTCLEKLTGEWNEFDATR